MEWGDLDKRIEFQEGVREHWKARLLTAETGEDAQRARGWIASVERVLKRLRQVRANAEPASRP